MKSDTRPAVSKCSTCDKEFKYESEKRRHEQSHDPQFGCKVCFKKFSFVSALRRHEKQHERTESAQCSKCGGKFRDETLLKRHMQYAHKGKQKCKKCSATFNSELALRAHMKTHKPESERKFHCNFEGCSKTFNFIHHLKHHQLTHTEDKPHICMECGKRFIQLHHLKIHQRVHKPDSWLTCTVLNCNKQFTNEYALRRHIATHKNKMVKNSEESIPNKRAKTKKLKEAKRRITRRQANKDAQDITNEIKELPVTSPSETSLEEFLNIMFKNKRKDENKSEIVDINSLDCTQEFEILDAANVDTFKEFNNNVAIEGVKDDIDVSISNCKTVLGRCLVTGETETNENCLCDQMTTESTAKEVPQVIPQNNDDILNYKENLNCVEKRRKAMNACETCECAGTCGIRDKVLENYEILEYETPELEIRKDGVVKIKGIFDMDIENSQTDYYNNNEVIENKFDLTANVQLVNSCKDVLGNCIVSGDGMIGEGCLCARMSAGDQQVIAQEIEDITPCPKGSWYKEEL